MYGLGLYASLAVGVAALVTQYVLIYLGASTVYSNLPACEPGFGGAGQGWDKGVCPTEEQVWCDANTGHHPDCATAACRAEEVRLSMSAAGYRGSTVYKGCPDPATLDLLRAQMTLYQPLGPSGHRDVGPCVPTDDRRAHYLPVCNTRAAACRSLFYRTVTPGSSTVPLPDSAACAAFWTAAQAACANPQTQTCYDALHYPA